MERQAVCKQNWICLVIFYINIAYLYIYVATSQQMHSKFVNSGLVGIGQWLLIILYTVATVYVEDFVTKVL